MASKTAGSRACGVAPQANGPTTLLIRNLPRRFTAWDLVAELKLYVRPTAFDYVYVPWDQKGLNNVGYAFVNFVDASFAVQAEVAMEGMSWRTGSRSRPVKIQPAHIQGLAENLDRFVEQGGAEPGHAPLLFSAGAPRSLESALRALSPLRREISCDDTSTATTCSWEDAGLGSPRYWASAGSDTEDHLGPRSEEPAAASPGVVSAPPGLELSRCCLETVAVPPPGFAIGSDMGGGAMRPWRPPPGLEDVVPVNVRSSPGYAACHEEVGALLQKLLLAQLGCGTVMAL